MPNAKRTARAVWTLLAALIALTATLPTASHAATTGSVSGIVRDNAGNPLPKASVFLAPAGLVAHTSSTGYYAFVGVLPGTYTLTVTGDKFDTASAPVTVTQDLNSAVDFSLAPTAVKTGGSVVSGLQLHPTQPMTQYPITSTMEQQGKSQPNNLYQFTGLVFGQPGITYDPSGYVHIRGTDINQVGFAVDGIPITQPITNTFATNLNTIGLRSANLYTGGADASYGNSTGGFINEITASGRDLHGGIFETTLGPGYGWNYKGNYTQYGNVTPDNKFDYYLAALTFKNELPGNTQAQSLDSSIDGIIKLNYYADPSNTFTAFYSHGFEDYELPQQPQDPTTQRYIFNEQQGTSVDTGAFQQDRISQAYDFMYASLKHNFTADQFATFRVFRLLNLDTINGVNTHATYENFHGDQIGAQVDYTNQLSEFDRLRAGFEIVPETTHYRFVQDFADGGPVMLPTAGTAPFGYIDKNNNVNPTRSAIYLSNQLKMLGDKATLETGVRYGAMHFNLQNGVPSYTDTYLDPRIGAAYSPNRTTVFRSSFSVESEFPDSYLIQTLSPEQVGLPPTAINPAAQTAFINGRYAPFNKLGTEHANDFDLGVEQAFNVPGSPAFMGGPYTFSVTGYRHDQYDLFQYNRTFFVNPVTGGPSGPRSYTSDGKGRSSGFEFLLSKPKRNMYDLNGWVAYTNQVARATSSDFDTGLLPYFATAFLGSGAVLGLTDAQFRALDQGEYPTTYDQRHTLAVVLNKRVNKLLETTAILDAGSGFPFVNGLAGVQGSDAQHSQQGMGDAIFTEVPITLLDKTTLQPLNPTIGRSGWHYKISLNTTFHLTEATSLFLNVDNLFDKQTVVNYGTTSAAGVPYYAPPSAQYPQGRLYYGPSTILTPIFLSFGIRQKF